LSKQQSLVVGKITGFFGIKGWVKIHSFTDPRENILRYSPWLLKKGSELKQIALVDGNLHGKAVIACLEGIDNRDLAASLQGYEILIAADSLPKAAAGEYYWRDLIGLQVETEQGVPLGVVDYLLETGANDVLIVKDNDRERLIPFLQGTFVKSIDLQSAKMIVDWDPEF
jgi:16S rRNA processing protein RimM